MKTNKLLFGFDGGFRNRCFHILLGSGRSGAIQQVNSICTVLENASPEFSAFEF
jgi:hypothetical protein